MTPPGVGVDGALGTSGRCERIGKGRKESSRFQRDLREGALGVHKKRRSRGLITQTLPGLETGPSNDLGDGIYCVGDVGNKPAFMTCMLLLNCLKPYLILTAAL